MWLENVIHASFHWCFLMHLGLSQICWYLNNKASIMGEIKAFSTSYVLSVVTVSAGILEKIMFRALVVGPSGSSS